MLKLKARKEDEEETQEVTASLATTKEAVLYITWQRAAVNTFFKEKKMFSLYSQHALAKVYNHPLV